MRLAAYHDETELTRNPASAEGSSAGLDGGPPASARRHRRPSPKGSRAPSAGLGGLLANGEAYGVKR